jgi:hypothetical protein
MSYMHICIHAKITRRKVPEVRVLS